MNLVREIGADPMRRDALIDDCVATLDAEVARKKGAVAFAVQKTYNAVGRMEGGRLIRNVFDKLLDEFLDAMQPLYDAYRESQSVPGAAKETFEAYIEQRPDEIAAVLLTVTDRERDRVDNRILVLAYNSLRGTALKLVRDSVPAVGRMISRHV